MLKDYLAKLGYTPNRHPIIRFFISSTFVDMVDERNELRSIIKELSEEYAKEGWTIEAVDLRWGISSKEALDNKTMTICLDEISNCQMISPRPNFIMLIGERYGWVPLPEIIPQNVVDGLDLTDEERILFEQWYSLDTNYIPTSQYVLKGREGRYVDNEYFKIKVLEPLTEAFRRNAILERLFWGKSATEQEIDKGGFVEEAEQHVIAYCRRLKDVPDINEIKRIFYDDNPEKRIKQSELINKVRKRFTGGLLIDNNISYSDYKAKSWLKDFKDTFTRILKQIINAEIKKANINSSTYEKVEHISYAYNNSEFFIYRDEEINAINEYVNSKGGKQALWVSGPEGNGKTALLSYVAREFLLRSDFHTIVRFCGLTNASSTRESLMASLREEMKPYLADNFSDVNNLSELFRFHYSKYDKSNISHFKEKIIIILDGVDLLESKWYGNNLHDPNIRIIISAEKFPALRNHKEGIILRGIKPDLKYYILPKLKRQGRRVSSSQEAQLQEYIFREDQTTLYAELLCSWITSFPSYQHLPKLPNDLDSLVSTVLNKSIKDDEQKGYGVLKNVVSLLCLERDGLSESEILSLIAADDRDYKAIMHDIDHRIDKSDESSRFEREIPTIVWSRIRRRIDPFIRLIHKGERFYYSFRSQQIQEIISREILDPATTLVGRKRLYDFHSYYSLNTAYSHSVRNFQADGVRYLESALDGHVKLKHHQTLRLRTQILNRCFFNTEHLLKKLLLDKNDLLSAFEDIQSILKLNPDERTDGYIIHLARIKTALNLLRAKTYETLILEVLSLPDNNSLRKICPPIATPILKNCLRNIPYWEDSIIWTANVGNIQDGCVSKDGGAIVFPIVRDGECFISSVHLDRNDLYVGFNRYVNIVASDSLEDIIAYDSGTDEDVVFFRGNRRGVLSQESLVQRIDISSDGHMATIFYSNKFVILRDWEEIQSKEIESLTYSGCMTRDGRFLWFLSDGKLVRHDIVSGKDIFWDYIPLDNENLLTHEIGYVNVVAATEHVCLLAYMLGYNAASAYGGKALVVSDDYKAVSYYVPIEYHENSSHYPYYINEEERKIVLHNRGQQVNIYSINEDFSGIFFINTFPSPLLVDVSGDLRFALTFQGIVVDFQLFLQATYFVDGINEGLNSISAPSTGDFLIASIGKEVNTERYKQYLRFVNDNGCWDLHKVTPGFDVNYQYVSKSVISPDASIVVMASRSETNDIIIYDKDNKLIGKSKNLPYQCTGLDVSCDGKYILAGTGTYYNSSDYLQEDIPHVFVFKTDGVILFSTTLDGGDVGEISDQLYFSPNNRYAIWKGSLIIDLIKGHVINSEDALYTIGVDYHWGGITHNIDASPPYTKISSVISPDGQLLYYNCTNHKYMDVQRRLITYGFADGHREIIDTDLLIIAICPSGRHILFLSSDGHLFIKRCLGDTTMRCLAESVQLACFCNDGDNVFVQHLNGTLALMTIQGSILGVSYIGSSYNMQICDKGLYASNRMGRFFLFDVKKEFGVNQTAWCTLIYHWNLETKALELEPTAICPHCGHQVKKDSAFIKTINKISERYYAGEDCWDEKSLHGHVCPHCGGLLSFTPFFG